MSESGAVFGRLAARTRGRGRSVRAQEGWHHHQPARAAAALPPGSGKWHGERGDAVCSVTEPDQTEQPPLMGAQGAGLDAASTSADSDKLS